MSENKRGLKKNPLFKKTDQIEVPIAAQSEEAEQTESEGASNESRTASEPTMSQTEQSGERSSKQATDQMGERPIDHPTDRLTDPSNDQPVDQSTNPLTDLSIELSTRQVMSRPMAFYLYEEQGEELNELVRRLRKKYKLKTDRSALLRAILTEPVLNYHEEENDRKLVDRLLNQESNRLIGR